MEDIVKERTQLDFLVVEGAVIVVVDGDIEGENPDQDLAFSAVAIKCKPGPAPDLDAVGKCCLAKLIPDRAGLVQDVVENLTRNYDLDYLKTEKLTKAYLKKILDKRSGIQKLFIKLILKFL